MGVADPAGLSPEMLRRVVATMVVRSYADLWDRTELDQLLAEPPESWARDWVRASPDHVGLVHASR